MLLRIPPCLLFCEATFGKAHLILNPFFKMCNTKNVSVFIQKLQEITQQSNDSIEKAVALEALSDDYDNPEEFFELLFRIGCVSGMVSSLIYYNQTEAFFDTHYLEIMELKTEFEESIGQPMEIPYELKNYLAWFAFEETARKLWESE